MRKTILVIEDDADIIEVMRFNLEREGFRVVMAGDGETGLREVSRGRPDFVLLDLMLPGIDGLEVCRRLRGEDPTRDLPILILTAKGEEADVIVGLEMGADDYLVKPFSPRELVARIKSVLRRIERATASSGQNRVQIGELLLDAARHEVHCRGAPVALTRAEFRLLWTLAQRPGRVFPRSELADRITAGESFIIDRNVDVHISSIRRKLGSSGDVIATVRGVGYKCKD
jgi:two-component system phosphate regulon response regulator PhoB